MSIKPEFKNCETLGTPKVPLSHAACVGGMIFLSGQFAVSPKTGKLVDGGLKAQVHQTFSNIEATLKDLNCTFSDIIKTTVYLRDMADFQEMNEIYKTYFVGGFPARTTVAVVGLPMDARIEIDVISSMP